MIKTLDEYRKLGYPEDYLKNGDQVDMPLARFITHIENIEDKCGVFTSLHTDGICGNEPTTRAVKRHSYGDPYIYIGEATLKERWNHNPELARKIFISSPYRAKTKEKMDENITLAKKACRIIKRILIEGKLQNDHYKDKNGNTQYAERILVD